MIPITSPSQLVSFRFLGPKRNECIGDTQSTRSLLCNFIEISFQLFLRIAYGVARNRSRLASFVDDGLPGPGSSRNRKIASQTARQTPSTLHSFKESFLIAVCCIRWAFMHRYAPGLRCCCKIVPLMLFTIAISHFRNSAWGGRREHLRGKKLRPKSAQSSKWSSLYSSMWSE